MDFKKYQQLALRSESNESFCAVTRVDIRVLHGIIGLVTESGELMDAVKKAIFYNKELDKINLIEEIGDIFWYIAILLDALDTDIDDVLIKNINKLKVRYPEKFTSKDALNRNLDKERSSLE